MPDIPTVPAGLDASPSTNPIWVTAHQRVVLPELGFSDADMPAETDVRDGVIYAAGIHEGDLVLPAEPQVRLGVGFGANGTEYEGTYVVTGASYLGC